ncbi:glycoside hydrolase family 10 protein [Didymella exigua CBS 183.55]|uniref:Glycoside hydrolase family 10 protein n=1 Tax=Didymella exigua CBS 183.55 TaxID=1150837 RepID=A0A6A5RM02_9PLEO|nr:glycoside hydrolase family 10 protein [Didymella exigua CBS 183.55]KAF1928290.1 glycoside hydrolase family 10 protein [Didymella exigua CBS 183.55]
MKFSDHHPALQLGGLARRPPVSEADVEGLSSRQAAQSIDTTMKKKGRNMKLDVTKYSRGNFNFSTADQIGDFATSNGELRRGHTAVWLS